MDRTFLLAGLAAAVFSKDQDRCNRIVSEFECGIVWVNNTQLSHISAPWGGVKVSQLLDKPAQS